MWFITVCGKNCFVFLRKNREEERKGSACLTLNTARQSEPLR